MSELELETTNVTIAPTTEVDLGTTEIQADLVTLDSTVEGYQKEYSIVGDGLYASVSAEEAPQWLTGILDNVISSRLDANLTSLQQANLNIINSLAELEVAKNQYQELINIDATVDGVVASRLSTLNATVDQNSATISRLDATSVTPEQASAIAGNVIEAELNSGSIGARIGNLDTAISNTNGALASSVEVLEAQFGDVSSSVSTLESTVIATADKAEANFAYNATVTLNNTNYSTGFGLATSLIDAGIPVGSSEFWVRSDNVKFVDTLNNTVLKGDAQGLTFPGAGSIKSEGYNLATNSGVFMGYNPGSLKYELMAGNTTQYLKWNGSNLSVQGDITATSISVPNGSIGNAAIADAAITNAKIGNLAVTNAKIGDAAITNAKIGSLAVSTLKIEDNAVTIPTSSYTAGGVQIGTGGTVNVQSVYHVATGAPVTVMTCLIGRHIYQPYETEGRFIVRIYRGGSLIYQSIELEVATAGAKSLMISPTIRDIPPAGGVTYYLQVYVSTGVVEVSNRFLGTLETKK